MDTTDALHPDGVLVDMETSSDGFLPPALPPGDLPVTMDTSVPIEQTLERAESMRSISSENQTGVAMDTSNLQPSPDETPSGDTTLVDTPSPDLPASFFLGSTPLEEPEEQRNILVGICAMAKKSHSKPMQEILDRLLLFDYLKPIVFEEETILKQPVENWPLCDCLISFHSKGFPLDKAVRYAELRKPMVINDLYMQYKIQDRRLVHQILAEQCVDQPRYVVLDRKDPSKCKFLESEDHIEVNDVSFHKPFVEKPVSAEDHNVYIYFPSTAGGGSQRLFRKIGSRSSVYSPVSTVRKTGSYIYEEFMPTDGTDVKVYTVGPDYAHAEARKAPALDGKVERDKDGKEVRYPIILTAKEKLIARKVCMAFKQAVCGFDLLRANGRSYVCDVNGFSFVKTSMKYYDDCAKILGHMILQQLAPTLHIPYGLTCQPEDIPIVPTTYGTMMELRNVIAIVRHGDRTPKQKMKMEVRHKKFFELFEKYGGYKSGQLKLKKPKQLQEILDTARFLLAEIDNNSDPEIEEKRSKLEQLKAVLEMYGHFSGINRKVQMKFQPTGAPKKSSDDDVWLPPRTSDGPRDPSLVLILKWGGELTPAGKIQAEELGKAFRCMYPGGQGNYGQSPGLGLLRLHSTFRHDLKIYASDEGRVQMTAAAFAKGFLALEGELTPILVQMVKSANMNGLLDNDNESSKYQNIVKEKLQAMLNLDRNFTEDDQEKLASTGSSSLVNALRFINNPHHVCERMYEIMQRLLDRIKELKSDPKAEEMKLYHSESWELMIRRWSKLFKDFKMKDGSFDISKIPDIYDCIKYDLQHNTKVLRFVESELLHSLSKAMADIVIPQEYGITREEKMLIGLCICTPLLRKILVDLQRNVDEESTRLDSRYSKGVSTPHRHVRTRLYFTSESHIHSLLTILRFGGLLDVSRNPVKDEQWARAMEYVNAVSELNYMTQIVIMMYEDPTKDPASDERFHVEVHFSPGACTLGTGSRDPKGPGYRSQYEQKEAREKSKQKLQEEEAFQETERRRRHSCVSKINTPDGANANPSTDTSSSDKELKRNNSGLEPLMEVKEKDIMSDVPTGDIGLDAEDSPRSTVASSMSLDSDLPGDSTATSAEQAIPGADRAAHKKSSISSDSWRELPNFPAGLCEGSYGSSLGDSWREAMYPVLTERRLDKLVDLPHDNDWANSTASAIMPTQISDAINKSGMKPLRDGNGEENFWIHLPGKRRRCLSGPFSYSSYDVLSGLRGRGSLISTKVISGFGSAPNLSDPQALIRSSSGPEGWKVPSIRPLETLHNSLTLKQLETFLKKMTETPFRTPVSSPPTPNSLYFAQRGYQPPYPQHPMTSSQAYSVSSSSACSSGGPSSPTSMASPPDDIMRRLKQLIDRRNEAEGQASSQEANSESETSSQVESPRLGGSQTLSVSQNSNSSVMEALQK